ncbi:aldo/keto reductase [Xenophilus sp. Marseille-Q4582]|uniref:aldo/keto reductase n=1 Tax=Xenophilus sp. Marseille-Q4582 TaxID=2866600 RepID=UPI001CE41D71|nr:aldo/keto reductase [Xenophilus sp. Marseille-Q4582]
MKYVKLGRTGLTVSRIALGMMTYGTPNWRPWVLEEAPSRAVVRHAVEQGINFFDTADMYSAGESEVLTGKFVREFCRREEVVIATKAYYPVSLDFKGGNSAAAKPDRVPNADGLSRKRLFHAVDESLRRLGTDYIDLWQIHRLDHDTPIEETMEALHDIVKSGKVRYIGASSMFAWQFAKAQQVAKENRWTRFVAMQNHYNLVYREEEREMIPLCQDQGVGLIPWSPLARGFLAGNRKADDAKAGETRRAQTDDIAQKYYYADSDFAVVQALTGLAQARGLSNATLAYAWLLHKGITGPIVGASKTWQIDEAVAALDVALSADEIAKLEAPYRPHPILGHV